MFDRILGLLRSLFGVTSQSGNPRNNRNGRLVELSESKASRFWKVEYGALSAPEQVFLSVWELEAEVNNGGFHQYFWNSSGALTDHACKALQAIGATKAAALVAQATAITGKNINWTDDNARMEAIGALSQDALDKLDRLDKAFFEYPDDLTDLLYRYVAAHRENFSLPVSFDDIGGDKT